MNPNKFPALKSSSASFISFIFQVPFPPESLLSPSSLPKVFNIMVNTASLGVPIMAQWLVKPTSIHEDLDSNPGLTQ